MGAARAPRQGGEVATHGTAPTAERILDVAERLAQTRGYNGFSYADVAAELGLTTAALHYHYAGKAELGRALVDRYAGRFADALTAADAGGGDAARRLARYTELYVEVVRHGRLCLCGMLAAEYETLPPAMQAAVVEFFDQSERWLARVLAEGRRDGSLRFHGSARDAARDIVSDLEGAMLLARVRDDPAHFQSAVARLLRSFRPRSGQ
jgi:TetR/AcrR family transcriptional regulator, transcriptional repressor for nem operon